MTSVREYVAMGSMPASNGTMAMFATVWPATQLIEEVLIRKWAGSAEVAGDSDRKPGSDEPVTVTFTATAPTPDAGTPPRPATCRPREIPGIGAIWPVPWN